MEEGSEVLRQDWVWISARLTILKCIKEILGWHGNRFLPNLELCSDWCSDATQADSHHLQGLCPSSRKASSNNPELSVTLWMCRSSTLVQLNMDWLLRETARPKREPALERRQSEINGDGQKKVIAEGELECENVSIAKRNREDGGRREMFYTE